MRRPTPWLFLLLFLLASPLSLPAAESVPAPGQPIDFTRLLPPPPTPGSVADREDKAVVRAWQQRRTPEMEALAQADAARTAQPFLPALGRDLAPEKLPLTMAFFETLRKDADAMLGEAKAHWNRPRPPQADPDIRPSLRLPHNASYPSGHSTYATAAAVMLAGMVPERAAEIYDRAEAYRLSRIIGGVHYPSDIAAGRIAGTVIAATLLENAAFVEGMCAAGVELRQSLGLAPRPCPGPGIAAKPAN
ncbi:phosphatase PAP2 family protein [Solidesulfovibrio sp.]|uniref:acid phosphatase n=1 Tax=Solidesulfovibrio sp. TaxID=2910990 RepID=UPI002B1F8FB0|nr:phosphatase PAP2 family protein [Solidesulfovibrio sp.]MEA5087999.1 phosphatase PAP2 family protein [Solidesulfovibrio sp.]